MVIEILTAILVIALGVATVIAAYIGLLSFSGVVRLARCPRCNHLAVTSAGGSPRLCSHCRYVHMRHPLDTLRQAHTRDSSEHIISHGR